MSVFYKLPEGERRLFVLKSRGKDFVRLGKKGAEGVKAVTSPHFIVAYGATRFDGADFHVGWTVSKKSISKLAVVRNKVKRRLRMITRETIGERAELSSLDILIIARTGTQDIPYAELREEVRRLFLRIPMKKV